MDPLTLTVISVVGGGLVSLLVALISPSLRQWLKKKLGFESPADDYSLGGTAPLYHAPRKALPRSARKSRKVNGCLILGAKDPDSARAAVQNARPLGIGWRQLRGDDIFLWLAWQTRLVPLVGRGREMDSLLAWARTGAAEVRARIVAGPGGAGKTRLAAEVADALRKEGWAAGFVSLGNEGAQALLTRKAGTLLLVDYPEEQGEAVRDLLAALKSLRPEHPVRVLLLTRHGSDFWEREIDDAEATFAFDTRSLDVGPLQLEDLHALFRAAQESLAAYKQVPVPEPSTEDDLQAWLTGSRSPRRPLFVLAAAAASVLYPENRALGLTGAAVVLALVRREMTRLRDEGQAAGLPTEALPRLTALAAVAGGLDRTMMGHLAEESALELKLPAPDEIFDKVKATGRLRDGRLPAPVPDLLGAALLVEVLREDADLAPEWLWAVLEGDVERGLDRLGRLSHDAEVVLGLGPGPSEWLARTLEGYPERCEVARGAFEDVRLPAGLLPAARVIWQAGLDGETDAEKRAGFLNNLSVHLAAAGDGVGALAAIREAVEIDRRLAASNPARYEPDLAQSLNNLSVHLAAAGDGAGALAAIREAVEIRRRLAASNPARYEPELAQSLNNLSLRLADAGDGAGALAAIREAVEIDRRLAASNPARYEPELAGSLNNLSNRLADAGDGAGALAAIREAVEIRRRLAASNPARYEPELAQSLNNLSVHLAAAGDGAGALATIREAVEIGRRLAASNPARYEPELAQSLNNLSVRLAAAGDDAGALAAIREAVEIDRRLAASNPARYEPELAQSLNNLSNLLAETGDGAGALAAIREAVKIRRRLAASNPARYEPELAGSLNNLSNRLADAGDGAGALAAAREAARLIEPHAARYPDSQWGQWQKLILAWLEELESKKPESG